MIRAHPINRWSRLPGATAFALVVGEPEIAREDGRERPEGPRRRA
jgi:hypothetical protein